MWWRGWRKVSIRAEPLLVVLQLGFNHVVIPGESHPPFNCSDDHFQWKCRTSIPSWCANETYVVPLRISSPCVSCLVLIKYVSSKSFSCFDGSATIPFEFVNDDYCDCQGRMGDEWSGGTDFDLDGSDEPGTSACPNGRFFCENKGYLSSMIPSHFVGDSICGTTSIIAMKSKPLFVIDLDCCDGSDEYETRIVCNNTCLWVSSTFHRKRNVLSSSLVNWLKRLTLNAKRSESCMKQVWQRRKRSWLNPWTFNPSDKWDLLTDKQGFNCRF